MLDNISTGELFLIVTVITAGIAGSIWAASQEAIGRIKGQAERESKDA